jgi:hypothetical protein
MASFDDIARVAFAPGAGYPALPGSTEAFVRTLPPEYLIEPKVADCPRHRSYATGGLGYSEPYSCWTPLGNGCVICQRQDPANRPKVLKENLEQLRADLTENLQHKEGLEKAGAVAVTLMEMFALEHIEMTGGSLGDKYANYHLTKTEHMISILEKSIADTVDELQHLGVEVV